MRIAETEIMSMSSKVHKSEIDIFRVPDSTSWPKYTSKSYIYQRTNEIWSFRNASVLRKIEIQNWLMNYLNNIFSALLSFKFPAFQASSKQNITKIEKTQNKN